MIYKIVYSYDILTKKCYLKFSTYSQLYCIKMGLFNKYPSILSNNIIVTSDNTFINPKPFLKHIIKRFANGQYEILVTLYNKSAAICF